MVRGVVFHHLSKLLELCIILICLVPPVAFACHDYEHGKERDENNNYENVDQMSHDAEEAVIHTTLLILVLLSLSHTFGLILFVPHIHRLLLLILSAHIFFFCVNFQNNG